MRKRPIKGSIMILQSWLTMHACAQKVLVTLESNDWTYIELPVCQEDYFFCTEGLQVTLFDVFGVPFLGSWGPAWKLTKLSKDVFTGLPCISTVFLLSSLLNRGSEVSQRLSWLDSFGFPGLCSVGTFKRNCSVSCARPVISDLHFGQTLDGRPDLEKRGKSATFLTENLERESKSINFLTENFG